MMLGGMALGGANRRVGRQSQERAAARRGITLAQYLKESGKKKAKIAKKEPAKKKAPAKKRGRPAKEPVEVLVEEAPLRVRKAPANKYDLYDVRKRLFSKDAKQPLRAYDDKQQKRLNKDLVKLGSGARCSQCPYCGGAWYDDVWNVVKQVAPVVAPLLL
jgi:hypothetical protein